MGGSRGIPWVGRAVPRPTSAVPIANGSPRHESILSLASVARAEEGAIRAAMGPVGRSGEARMLCCCRRAPAKWGLALAEQVAG